MPERDISFCVLELQLAWAKAQTEYLLKHPEASRPFLTCTYRSPEEQAELYAQGRTKPGKIVTQLKKGGKHNSKPAKAFDIAFKKPDGSLDWSVTNFKRFAAIMKKVAPTVECGGDWKRFKDWPHYQV